MVVSSTRFAFDVDGVSASGLLYAAREPRARIVLAHGAGSRQNHPWMVHAAQTLAARDLDVFTFDFIYAAAGRRVPDRAPVLEATWRAALAAVESRRDRPKTPLFIGGKSMGGRIATQVAASGDTGGAAVAGLVLLGYPLHPPGKPHQLRVAHLPQVRAPMLFVQGSRDPFGGADELRPIVESLSRGSRLFVVEGGDHSLALPKRRGVAADDVMVRVADELAQFVTE
jgi:predicted alpha/beta-hydrolase family hydrolase